MDLSQDLGGLFIFLGSVESLMKSGLTDKLRFQV